MMPAAKMEKFISHISYVTYLRSNLHYLTAEKIEFVSRLWIAKFS